MTSNNTPADVREAAAKIALSWTPVDGHAVEQNPLESPCGWTRRCIANAIRNMPLSSHEPDGQQAVEVEAVKATGEYLIDLLGKAVRGEAIRDMAEAIGSFRAAMTLATPQPTERERIVAWLRDLPEDEWYPRHVADAIERGGYLASDPG